MTRFDPAAPAVVLSPHLDDAVWSTFGLLAGEPRLRVVNLFAGIPPAGTMTDWDRTCGATDSADHVRARRAEDVRALAVLDIEPVDLDLLDQQYRDGRAEALEDVLTAIDRAVPAACAVHASAGIGRHPDHVRAREAALALAREGMPAFLYADYGYCVRSGWPTWVEGERGHAEADAQWREDLAGVEGIELERPQVRRLAPDLRRRKAETMRAYGTQFGPIERIELQWQIDGRSVGDPELCGIEAFWPLPSGDGRAGLQR